jgi:hypothetical protein
MRLLLEHTYTRGNFLLLKYAAVTPLFAFNFYCHCKCIDGIRRLFVYWRGDVLMEIRARLNDDPLLCCVAASPNKNFNGVVQQFINGYRKCAENRYINPFLQRVASNPRFILQFPVGGNFLNEAYFNSLASTRERLLYTSGRVSGNKSM